MEGVSQLRTDRARRFIPLPFTSPVRGEITVIVRVCASGKLLDRRSIFPSRKTHWGSKRSDREEDSGRSGRASLQRRGTSVSVRQSASRPVGRVPWSVRASSPGRHAGFVSAAVQLPNVDGRRIARRRTSASARWPSVRNVTPSPLPIARQPVKRVLRVRARTRWMRRAGGELFTGVPGSARRVR